MSGSGEVSDGKQEISFTTSSSEQRISAEQGRWEETEVGAGRGGQVVLKHDEKNWFKW